MLKREREHVMQDTVNPVADAEPVFLRLDVDVRGPVLDGLGYQQVERLRDGCAGGQLRRVLRFIIRGRGKLADLFFDGAARPVIEVDGPLDIRVDAEGHLDPHPGLGLDVFDGADVFRVGHDHHQRVVDDIQGDKGMFPRHLFRDKAQRPGLYDVPFQVDQRQVEMDAEDNRQLPRV